MLRSLILFHLPGIMPAARAMLMKSTGDVTIVLDAHNRVIDLNPAAWRLVNFKTPKVKGRLFGSPRGRPIARLPAS